MALSPHHPSEDGVAFYEGHVVHHRKTPVDHRFEYPVFLWSLDLDALGVLPKRLNRWILPWVQVNRWGIYSFQEKDYLPTGQGDSLKERVQRFVKTIDPNLPPVHKTVLLTHLKFLGWAFNPVSFYFCWSEGSGSPLGCIAEVTNTFQERHLYWIPWNGKPETRETGTRKNNPQGVCRWKGPKAFYVSPFSHVGLEFEFRLHTPDQRLALGVYTWGPSQGNDKNPSNPNGTEYVPLNAPPKSELHLMSLLHGHRRPATWGHLMTFTCRYPAMAIQTIWLIHWQALMLYIKRTPYFGKDRDPQLQREVLNPRKDLATFWSSLPLDFSP